MTTFVHLYISSVLLISFLNFLSIQFSYYIFEFLIDLVSIVTSFTKIIYIVLSKKKKNVYITNDLYC